MAKGRDNRNREEKKKKKPKKDLLAAEVAPPLSFRHHTVVKAPEQRPEG